MKTKVILPTVFFSFLSLAVFSQQTGESSDTLQTKDIKNFESWDRNGDGKISFNEYVVTVYPYFDTNMDNEIDESEIGKVHDMLPGADITTGTEISDSVASTGLTYGAGTDTTNRVFPGDNTAINKEAFYNDLQNVFNRWDENGDYYLDEGELSKHWNK